MSHSYITNFLQINDTGTAGPAFSGLTVLVVDQGIITENEIGDLTWLTRMVN